MSAFDPKRTLFVTQSGIEMTSAWADFRSSSQPRLSCASTSRPPRHSVSMCLTRWSFERTKWSN